MGDSGLTHKVGTFSSCADDLHTGGILQAVYTRDSPATWSVSLYCIGQRSQVYGSLLEELPEGHGYTIDDETTFHPQTNGQSEKTIHVLKDML